MHIKIIGKDDTAEYNAGLKIKQIFENTLNDRSGKVVIMTGFNCFGQGVKDIDIVVLGEISDLHKDTIYTYVKGQNIKANRQVSIKSFCFTIEVKDHTPEDVKFEANRALVRYKEKWHDATYQSDEQKISLKRFLEEKFDGRKVPYICNFLWFRNIRTSQLPDKPHNYLGSDLTYIDIMTSACEKNPPQEYKGNYYFNSYKLGSDTQVVFEEAYKFFAEYRKNIGKLTRSKLEKITKGQILKNQEYVQQIGKKLLIIRGKAGTGKTIKLLHIAYDLCNKGERCLILTYNKALVSDIERLIALADVSSDIAGPTIKIRTIHSFIRILLTDMGIYNKNRIKDIENFRIKLEQQVQLGNISHIEAKQEISKYEQDYYFKEYEKLKSELIEWIRQGLLNEDEIQNLMKQNHQELAWDKILIDEAQDWPKDEKEILFMLFKPNNFIIGDGVDQLVRGINRTEWQEGVQHHIEAKGQRKSLRQESNLCRFVQAYSNYVDVSWKLDENDELQGGKVIIIADKYSKDVHEEFINKCKKDGNREYEMMFLVPPDYVERKNSVELRYGKQQTVLRRQFKYLEEWEKWGIKLWDGTSGNLNTFSTNINEHRLLQYDSCRGLEGWLVVNIGMDSFFEYKVNSFKDEEEGQLELLMEKEEKAIKWAHQWVMIVFTRAIDTIVITLDDKESKFAKIMRELYKEYPDFIEWRE